MRRLRLRRPSASLVLSFIALMVALGGTGIAALHLGKNTVGTKQLKKNAVTTSKIKNGAVTGSKINLGTLGTVPSATTASNANALGGQPPSAYQTTGNFLFAQVNTTTINSPVLTSGRGVVTVSQIGSGTYIVTFVHNITGCTWLGNYGSTNSGSANPDFATTELHLTTTPAEMEVREFDAAGNPVDGQGFDVAVLCP